MATFRHRTPPSAPRARRERGTTLVLMTLILSALLVMATLVIDGGQAYPQRRRAQNAADAASLAGARALDRAVVALPAEGDPGDVQTTVASVVEDNDADLEECWIIDGQGERIGPQGCAPAQVNDPGAAGVEVVASETRPTSFGDIVEQDSITARASAAATIQPLSRTGSPFIICGSKDAGGYDMLNPDGTVDVEKAQALGAVGVQGPKVPDCGAKNFKGKKDKGQVSLKVPSWIGGNNDNGFDHDIFATIVGATPCPTSGDTLNCELLLPIADDGRGKNKDGELHAVAWGVFKVTTNNGGNPRYLAEFIGLPSYVTGGETSDSTPSGTEARVIRLVA